MLLKIKRERWVIVKGAEIFCGLARCYQFKPIDNIGNTAIKTYLSKSKAEMSFVSSWRGRLRSYNPQRFPQMCC